MFLGVLFRETGRLAIAGHEVRGVLGQQAPNVIDDASLDAGPRQVVGEVLEVAGDTVPLDHFAGCTGTMQVRIEDRALGSGAPQQWGRRTRQQEGSSSVHGSFFRLYTSPTRQSTKTNAKESVQKLLTLTSSFDMILLWFLFLSSDGLS